MVVVEGKKKGRAKEAVGLYVGEGKRRDVGEPLAGRGSSGKAIRRKGERRSDQVRRPGRDGGRGAARAAAARGRRGEVGRR